MTDPIPCISNHLLDETVTSLTGHRRSSAHHARPQKGRRVTNHAMYARTIRTADALGLATGALLGTWSIGSLPAAAAGVAMLTKLLIPSRYRWRFRPSLIDDLPPTLALLGSVTMISSIAVLLIGYPGEARGALGAGAILLGTTLFSRALGYRVVHTLRQRGVGVVNAVIVGSGRIARRLARSLTSDRGYGVRLLGFVSDSQLTTGCYPDLGSVNALRTIVRGQHVDLIVIASDADPGGDVVGAVWELCRARCEIYVVPRLSDLPGSHRSPDLIGCTPLVRLPRAAFRGPSWSCKRILDVLIAGLSLIVIAPAFAMIALAVRKELGPGVIFKQQRIGLDGRPFTLYKFRSLAPLADVGGTRWNIDGDPQMGPVGRFIRSTGLDELPQLVNILKGDMSLVGPRPERPMFADQFSATIPGYRHRHRMPAGLTGYAAVSGLRGDTSIADRALVDNLYADSWSLWLDVKIMLRTCGQLGRRALSFIPRWSPQKSPDA